MLDEQRKVWYLRRIDLFESMTDDDIVELARLLNDFEIPAGIELLGNRDRDQVYLMKDGAVRIHTIGSSSQVTLALFGRGRLFGISGRFGNASPMLGATTIVPSYICITTWDTLMEVLLSHPAVMLKLVHAMASQLFDAENWLERLGMASPRSRLAHLLLELSEEFGEQSDGGTRIRFRLGHADLARMIGVSRETVSRIAGEFTRAGWISRDGGMLIVRDPDALKSQTDIHRYRGGDQAQ